MIATVGELISALKKFPTDRHVYIQPPDEIWPDALDISEVIDDDLSDPYTAIFINTIDAQG